MRPYAVVAIGFSAQGIAVPSANRLHPLNKPARSAWTGPRDAGLADRTTSIAHLLLAFVQVQDFAANTYEVILVECTRFDGGAVALVYRRR